MKNRSLPLGLPFCLLTVGLLVLVGKHKQTDGVLIEQPIVAESTSTGIAPSRVANAGGPDIDESVPEKLPPNADPVDGNESDREKLLGEKILLFIGDEERPAWCTYGEVVRVLGGDSVPLLRDMLNDQSYRNRWASISHMIAWLSDKSDEGVVRVLVDYIQRPDTWSSSSDPAASANLFWKAKLVAQLGFFETEDAKQILRDAFTEPGAEGLIEDWVDFPHEISGYYPRLQVVSVQGQAAKGLILSRDSDGIALVRERYEAFVHETQTNEYREQELNESMQLKYQLHSFIIDAMGMNDLIEEIGLQPFLEVWGTEEGDYLVKDKLSKYRGRFLGDGRTVVDSCPICGNTRK